jgi:hypothetical protein
VASLAAALNDPKRAKIGNPERNIWYVCFTPRSGEELDRIAQDLNQLGVTFQINHLSGEGSAGAIIAYLAIYDLEEQNKLLDSMGDRLEGPRRMAFENLVLARGPIPDDVLAKMIATIDAGKSPEYLADKLNELGIVAGRGQKWTPKKVRKAVNDADLRDQEHRRSSRTRVKER